MAGEWRKCTSYELLWGLPYAILNVNENEAEKEANTIWPVGLANLMSSEISNSNFEYLDF